MYGYVHLFLMPRLHSLLEEMWQNLGMESALKSWQNPQRVNMELQQKKLSGNQKWGRTYVQEWILFYSILFLLNLVSSLHNWFNEQLQKYLLQLKWRVWLIGDRWMPLNNFFIPKTFKMLCIISDSSKRESSWEVKGLSLYLQHNQTYSDESFLSLKQEQVLNNFWWSFIGFICFTMYSWKNTKRSHYSSVGPSYHFVGWC